MTDARRTRWVAHDAETPFVAALITATRKGRIPFRHVSDPATSNAFGLWQIDGTPYPATAELNDLARRKLIRRTRMGRTSFVYLTGLRRRLVTFAAEQRAMVTPAVRRRIFERDGWACVECGAIDELQADHVHPVSRGGRTEDDNLATLCAPCNRRKGARV